MSARELAGKLVDRVYARRKEGRFTRTFDPTHFEFRGGDSAARARGRRTRRTDPRPSTPSEVPLNELADGR